jgi:outer membrane receptor for ferrienterochelin and colicins
LWKWGTHRFRLAYAKGFRAPSLKELHFQFVDVNHQLFGNANLRPETSHFWQVHWQKEGSLNFSIRGYSNVVAEQIGLVDQLDGTYQYVNFAGFSSQGVETQVHATGKQLEWNIGLSAFKAQTDLVKSGEGDESAAPAQAATMEGQAELTWHINPHLQTSIFIKYNGARQRVVQNAEDEMQLVTAPAYTLLDLNALHWQSTSNRLQIALRLKNLLDVTSLANGFDTSGPETHTSGLTPIAWGRSAVVRLTYQWNQNR